MTASPTPSHGAEPAAPPPRRRTPGSRWWLIAAVLLVLGLGFTIRELWHGYTLPARAAAALPTMPDVRDQPQELRERLAAATALTAVRESVIAGVVELGRLYHANGFNAEAENCWRWLHHEQPREARWAYYLADLRRAASDYEAMDRLLERTIELAPDFAPALLQLANLRFKSGQPDEAARLYRRRLELLPGDAHARLGLVRVAQQAGDRASARLLLEAMVRDDPEFPPSHNLLAEILAAEGDDKGARQHRWLGREAGRLREPEDPWLSELQAWCFDPKRLRILATIQYQTGQGDRGIALMERALALAPDSAEGHLLLADLYLKLGDFTRARDAFRRGIDLSTDTAPTPVSYVNLSTAHRSLGDPAAAIAVVREGLARLPGSFELYDALGVALGDLGRMEEAIEAFREALALSPNDANTNFNLALALLGSGQVDAAVDHLQRSLKSQPTFAKSLVLLSEIELKASRLESARTFIDPLYDAYPAMPRARQLKGTWHLRMGRAAEAAKDLAAAEVHYRTGVEIDPQDADLQSSLGLLLLLSDRFSESLGPLERYHQLRPEAAQASFFLGQAYARLGRTADARRVLTEGERLALESNNPRTAEYCREILRSL